jgi:hypothetical protein
MDYRLLKLPKLFKIIDIYKSIVPNIAIKFYNIYYKNRFTLHYVMKHP